jgi:hypothetical protein
MENKGGFFSRRVVLLAVIGLTGVLASGTAQGADVALVVRPDVAVDNLTFAEVRRLFLGDRQFWTSNLRVTLLVRAPGARERDVVLKTIYQMSEAQFRQYWIAKVFRAEAAAGPRIVYSNEMAAEMVSGTQGAVALMPADQVPKGLKVVKINGLLPGAKDYPLH